MPDPLISSPPQVNFEWDWECTPPTASDRCDGKLKITAWLKVSKRRRLDPSVEWVIERKIMPQRFELTWELDTSPRNQINYCPKYKDAYKGNSNTDVNGHFFNHIKPLKLDPEKPDDSGDSLVGETIFKWNSSLLPIAQISGSGVTPLGKGNLSGNLGVSSQNYEFKVAWVIDLSENIPSAERSESAEISDSNGNLKTEVYCLCTSQSGTQNKSDAKTMWPAKGSNPIIDNDSLVKTP